MKQTIFATNTNRDLAKSLTKISGWKMGKCLVGRYADGEVRVELEEAVDGQRVYVLGSTFPPAENFIELLLLIHTLKVNKAKKVTVVIPYLGYAKSDQITEQSNSLSAKLAVQLIEEVGVDELIAVDLHSKAVEKFFTIPLKSLSAVPLLADRLKNLKIDNLAIVSPDLGGVVKARRFAKLAGTNLMVVIEKHRPQVDQAEVVRITGNVKGKNAVIVDDLIQTGNTLIKAAECLKNHGADEIYVCVTHLVPTAGAVEKLTKNSDIKMVMVTDTIPLPKDSLSEKFEIVSVVDLIAKAING